jgi:hypothetical protein
MAEKAIEIYLNDHLGGATLGSDLARQILEQSQPGPLRDAMANLVPEIEQDRETLLALMDALEVSRNPVKQVAGWLAEKASRVKFSGATSAEPDAGILLALETLRLGVAGKRCLWLALAQSCGGLTSLAGFDFDALAERAAAQERTLEEQRLLTAARVLATAPTGA